MLNVIDMELVLRETRDALALLEAGEAEDAKRALRLALKAMERSAQPLFQCREPPRRYFGPVMFITALHLTLVGWIAQARPVTPMPEPVRVALRLPVRKVAVTDAVGGGSTRPAPTVREHHRRRPLRAPTVLPRPIVDAPAIQDSPTAPESDEAVDADDGKPDGLPGSGGGGGSGPGVGPGRGSLKSKARKAWLTHTDWKCTHPEQYDVGRIVVRLRVEVLPDGKPGQITVVKAGPELFTDRALNCAREETYLPALDPDGIPIKGDAEFTIGFVN